ncbi:Z1 domain-containing protein [Luteolibacter marinus]|uniref:Z1 domain-containing protein n=1 Tax=Luteolibacter marinus TaxID=2776705 RepID=UPI0018666C8A|nr:Z1 domain-containing protein [Luteolibacter marinus]
MPPQVDRLVQMIRQKLPTHGTPERCAEEVIADFEIFAGPVSDEFRENVAQAREIVRAALEDVEILRRSSIIKPRDDWYQGPSATDRHWPALEGYLRQEKGWEDDAVTSIDEASNEVVSLLANPAGDQFRCRGLVIGYVQSGKTANMTAVIAKAVDAGYNLIVLLGGMTNKLRAQTQRRLMADVVMRHRELWQLHTEGELDKDFVIPPNRAFVIPPPGSVQLAVIKKVKSRLEAFHETIRGTAPATLRRFRVLLIDDECDQASVNSARDEYDITSINEVIRRIIRDLPAVSYVGYTATPFANVFINPFPHNRDELDDLYPEDFITALPRPEEYFGAREVFGVDPVDAGEETEDEEGRSVIRVIGEPEVALIRPGRGVDPVDFRPEITASLADAILWFIATCAIRRERGQEESHMTMLVHSSPRVVQHASMAEAIGDWIRENGRELRTGNGGAFDRFSEVLTRELAEVPPSKEAHQVRPGADELVPRIGEVLDALEIAVENGATPLEDRLDYEGGPKTYIVVGGAVLARGLTLEGLCVSFFLRTSKQYDTLLQMGRWFGYRKNFEDLPRLWTTADLAANFRALARIEEEIREDLEKYRNGTTPLDFGVRVRAVPGMAITSASKMKHAYRTAISYEGRHVQTIRYDHRKRDVVSGNWIAGATLIDRIGSERFDDVEGGLMANGVDVSVVRQFLAAYSISDAHMDLRKEHLLGFIDGTAERMPMWNVGIVQPTTEVRSENPLGGLRSVKVLTRSKLKVPETVDHADIKALMSKKDVLLDVGDRPGDVGSRNWDDLKALRPPVPLLILYPINACSEPRPTSRSRTALDAVGDLLGMAIVFPGETDRSGAFFEVRIEAPTPEQLDEEESEEDVDQPELMEEDGTQG